MTVREPDQIMERVMKVRILALVGILMISIPLGGCVLLAAGAAGVGLEQHREWCRSHYGNSQCARYERIYRQRFPMGFN
jgi:hypothetical protein